MNKHYMLFSSQKYKTYFSLKITWNVLLFSDSPCISFLYIPCIILSLGLPTMKLKAQESAAHFPNSTYLVWWNSTNTWF